MPRLLMTSQRVLPLVLVLTAVTALLPPPALGWTKTPVAIFNFILTPFALAGNHVTTWLRAPPQARFAAHADGLERNDLKLLYGQIANFERLYLAEQAKADGLQRQLDQLQKVQTYNSKTPVRPIVARISLRSSAAVGTVVLERGANHGVKTGAIAVYDGVHLIGRVTGEVSGLQCTLLPLTNEKSGLIDCAVLAKDRAEVALATAPKIQLMSKGDGKFAGQADRMMIINPGDSVVLIDASWSDAAQAMTIGTVESVRPNEMEPLRNTVVVRPAFGISQLTYVMLNIELDDGEALVGGGGSAAMAGGGGGPPMRWPVFAIFAFMAIVAQVSLRSALTLESFGSISPDIAAVLAAFVALFAQRFSALWACWLLGLAMDLAPQTAPASFHLIGPHALGYVLGGYVILHFRTMVFRRRIITLSLFTLICVIAAGAVSVVIVTIRSWYPGATSMHNGVVAMVADQAGTAVYSGLVAIPLGWMLSATIPLWGFQSSIPRRMRSLAA